MQAIRKNKLIPIIAAIALIIFVGLFARSGGTKHEPIKTVPHPNAKAADGDTTADTVRALTAEVTNVKEQNSRTLDENQKLLREKDELIKNRTAIEENVTRNLTERFSSPEASGSPVFSSLNAKIENLTAAMERYAPGSTAQVGDSASNSDMPAGLGFVPGADTKLGAVTHLSGEIKWIEPLGKRVALNAEGKPDLQPNGEAKLLPSAYSVARPAVAHADMVPESTIPPMEQSPYYGNSQPASAFANPSAQTTNTAGAQQQLQPGAIPYFTIPENATLLNASAMTTILGRIPVQGNVRDPMEFKVLVGRPNLAANGMDVPDDVYGMVVTGTAIGDWNLQCVEGHVYSVTFLFADGTIKTISKRRGGGQPSSGTNNTQRIGYISDEFGTPCVSGRLVTNAPSYLAQVVGLKTLETAAQAAAAAQTTVSNVPLTGGSEASVTGDQTKYILGKAAASGFDEVSNWMMKRLGDSFDAIYVPTGTKLAVHISEELTLDKDPNARRLDYGKANLSASKKHNRGLD